MIYFDHYNFDFTSVAEQTLPALSHSSEFDPDYFLALFYGNLVTTGVTNAADASMFFGAACGPDLGGFFAQRSVAAFAGDNLATTNCGWTQQNSHCGYLVNNAGAATARFFLDRFDDDGSGNMQPVIEHQVDPNSKRFSATFIYGPGVKGAKVFAFQLPTTVGQFTIDPGIGAIENGVLILSTSKSTILDDQSVNSSNVMWNLGMASSASKQGYSSWFSTDGTTTSALNATRQISGKILGNYDTTTLFDEVEFVSFNADGTITLDLTTSSGTAMYVYAIVLSGPKCNVRALTIPNPGTGDNIYTGLDFYPKAVVTFSNCTNNSAGTRVNRGDFGLGMAVSPTAGHAFTSVVRQSIPTFCDSGALVSQVLLMGSHDVGGNYIIRRNGELKTQIPFSDPDAPDGGYTIGIDQSGITVEFLSLEMGDDVPGVNIIGGNIVGSNLASG